ncbi:methyltransferase domain-containing protein [Enterobacter roggenkampii]|nr:class I SAM-dependent methyltransferase [Enterobacter roggenkampii]EJO48832.1 glycosyl transferase [Enterobacter sp. SST3]NUD86483.1 methyltransferase domain-containing protein [Escherichia coli]EHF8255966.1 class I SAM-dependent methyltransferase [Enterobacter roggenkampii]ELD8599313.1 methyltransferase domain-containing protein [Enterobacter roggenkampii]
MSSMYKKNKKYNFYEKNDSSSINYSDGSDTENRLYEIVLNLNDKSVWSNELAQKITDWPTEYHFSRQRHCLLRPLNIQAGEDVLELGCGCGAMTRYLGEIGAIVDSIEGTSSRARIAGERCRELENVKIHVDNFLEYESEKKYDWVLFIGVLEYAPLFSSASDPIQSYLEIAKKYLKPSGKLVVAIENKLGLKYFNGCAEDHLDEINLSIENRYKKVSPITFGKKEIKQLLNANGFLSTKFFYPFPDYKLPVLILDDESFNEANISQELLSSIQSRDYSGRTGRVFEESLVWPELCKNDIAQDLSNSFLIVAEYSDISGGKSNDTIFQKNIIASYYNCHRNSAFVTETRFNHDGQSITVSKSKINKCKPQNDIVLLDLEQEYVSGKSLQNELEQEWNIYKNLDSFMIYYKHWFNLLLTKADENNTIPGNLIDLTPFNVKFLSDSVFIFDQEWCINERVSLAWMAYRGVYWSLVNLKTIHPLEISPAEIASALLKSINIDFDANLLSNVQKKERGFLNKINGSDVQFSSLICKIPERVMELHPKHLQIINELRNKIALDAAVINEHHDLLEKLAEERDYFKNELLEIRKSILARAVIKVTKKARNILK